MIKLNIDKWLGLRGDDVNLKPGELAKMKNFKIVDNYLLQKRTGYSVLVDYVLGWRIQGQWYGRLNERFMHIVAAGGRLYYVTEDRQFEEVGELTDAPTTFFQFGDKLYIQNGVEYLCFDGVEIVDTNDVSLDSSLYSGTYPYILSIPAGKYEFKLGGGKGSDEDFGSIGIARGGRGGTIRFFLELAIESEVRIEKIVNEANRSPEHGASFWVYVNDVLYAAVGGGANHTWWYNSNVVGGYYGLSNNTGHGGPEQGMDGDSTPEGGKGANLAVPGAGGTNRGNSGNWRVDNAYLGSPGYGPDAGVNKGKGGIGGGNRNTGGCGYAGGGGGAFTIMENRNTGAEYGAMGQGGGGSSYVIDADNVTLLENSRGTNNGVAFVKISTVRRFGLATEVKGYIPTVHKSGKPDGTVTTDYEPINNLIGKRKQTFNGDGSAKLYKLGEKKNLSIDEVRIDGVLTTAYTVNTNKDEITFTTAPAAGTDNVEILYTHDNNKDRADVLKYTHARLYGGKNDNRVFLYGAGNRIIFSDLADGVPSAEYFPVFNTMDVGSSQYAVMGLSVQYDRMIIHKEKGAWWTQYDYDPILMAANFPVYPLNDNVGLSYIGTEQVIENNPYVVYGKQIYEFVASSVRDERNARYVSDRIQSLLDAADLSGLITFDNFEENEYWLLKGNQAFIYNYDLDVWYFYEFADQITTICRTNKGIVLGTDLGQLFLMDDSLSDNLVNIKAEFETGWMDYGAPDSYKFLNLMHAQMKPEKDSLADVFIATDRQPERHLKRIVPVSEASPKSVLLRVKAHKFIYAKFIVRNNEKKRLTFLGINAPAERGGTVR